MKKLIGLNSDQESDWPCFLQLGHFTQTDDRTQSMNDVWFNVDTVRTAETDLLAVNDEIADLPDLSHIGNLRSLDLAIFKPVSPMEGEA